MEKVILPGLPEKRAADYALADGNFARVIYTPQESKPDRVTIEAQAFQVDANGNFVAYANGAPSRTPGTLHTITKTGIGDTHTLQPGWVRVVGDYNADNLPENALVLADLPEQGEEGDQAYVEPTLYRWDIGMLESVMRGKATELEGILRNSAAIRNFDL